MDLQQQYKKEIYSSRETVDPYSPDRKRFAIKVEHLGRYFFAQEFVEKIVNVPKRPIVYDISCGTGYGSGILSRVAQSVYGFDKHDLFLRYANENYKKDNMEFIKYDLDKPDLESFVVENNLQSPDAIVCFETLEHIGNVERVLEGFYKTLKPGGYLICSLPNRKYEPLDESGNPRSPYHKHSFTKVQFVELVEKHGFTVEKVLGQPLANLLINKFKFARSFFNDVALKDFDSLNTWSKWIASPTWVLSDWSYSYVYICVRGE